MNFKIPQPLKREHEELHAELAKATKEPGKVGEAARAVAKLMHPHFVKEEEFALPPLALLAALAAGEAVTDSHDVVKMTERLKAELPEMIAEHQEIVRALKLLVGAAEKEEKPQYAHFAETLMLHAQTEEEVMYPAAILIGEYLNLRLQQ